VSSAVAPLPKTELHVHLEGTIRAASLLEIARTELVDRLAAVGRAEPWNAASDAPTSTAG
jgi:adenosine deaminase